MNRIDIQLHDIFSAFPDLPDQARSIYRAVCQILDFLKFGPPGTLRFDFYQFNAAIPNKATHELFLDWSDCNIESENIFQSHTITEHAAVCLSAIIVYKWLNKNLSIAMRGDRFDYFIIDNNSKELGLEVSGIYSQTVSSRTRVDEKRGQLLKNPHNLNGYVYVANFSRTEMYLGYYEQIRQNEAK